MYNATTASKCAGCGIGKKVRRVVRRVKKTLGDVKKMDVLFSKIIRLRDRYCQRCGSTNLLQCSHVLTKGAHSPLRWDELNAIALCLRCHLYWWHRDTVAAVEWFERKWPGRIQRLHEIEREVGPKQDRVMVHQALIERLRGLEGEEAA